MEQALTLPGSKTRRPDSSAAAKSKPLAALLIGHWCFVIGHLPFRSLFRNHFFANAQSSQLPAAQPLPRTATSSRGILREQLATPFKRLMSSGAVANARILGILFLLRRLRHKSFPCNRLRSFSSLCAHARICAAASRLTTQPLTPPSRQNGRQPDPFPTPANGVPVVHYPDSPLHCLACRLLPA
jgi:hypothetical protein